MIKKYISTNDTDEVVYQVTDVEFKKKLREAFNAGHASATLHKSSSKSYYEYLYHSEIVDQQQYCTKKGDAMDFKVSSDWEPAEYELGGIKLAVFREPKISKPGDVEAAGSSKEEISPFILKSLVNNMQKCITCLTIQVPGEVHDDVESHWKLLKRAIERIGDIK